MRMRAALPFAAFLGLMGVVGATLYAHAVPVPALGQAAYMALFHAAPLLFLSQQKPSLLTRLSAIFLLLGSLLFTGSIYAKYLGGWESATRIAPAGGTLLIGGWIILLVRGLLSLRRSAA
uniref:DUF423 domain-containing protein n=1 Tax=uncultured Bacteroidota bacterium TaxID=152509 RepID=H5SMT0_9BACT|nr:hypothetical protein HGMM_F50F04C29 [uncultured Bacteroidetes bacterium]